MVDGIEIGTMSEEKTLTCPKCDAPMEKVEFHAVVVDRCTGCKGLWFDNLEHEKLKLLHGSESIDTGDPRVGKRYDEVDRIQCPVCHTLMVRMADAKQHHIWYETCPLCSGVYLDAGEFADFKKENWLDAIRDWIKGRRHY